MSEEKQEEQKDTTDNSGEGNKPKKTSVLDDGYSLKKELEEIYEKNKELIERQEELMARKLLAGKSDATVEEQKPKEETPKEYRDRIMGLKK